MKTTTKLLTHYYFMLDKFGIDIYNIGAFELTKYSPLLNKVDELEAENEILKNMVKDVAKLDESQLKALLAIRSNMVLPESGSF